MQDPSWIQFECACHAKDADSLGALLVEAGALGVEERPSSFGDPHLEAWDRLLIAYFSSDFPQNERSTIEQLVQRFHVPSKSFRWSEHYDDGWSTKWKEFFHPLPIGERLVICPTWETFEPEPHQIILHIDPGMAFGTGHHATTRSCLLFLEKFISPDVTLLDVGCGSGILSLAALLLGLPNAVGIDIDPDAIMVANENAQLNGLADRCDFSTTPVSKMEGSFPLVVANIQAHILKPMAKDLRRLTQKNGHLILSGILTEQVAQLQEIFEQMGFSFLDSITDEEWVTILFQG